MTEELRLEYLGGMQVTADGQPLRGFISAKAPALLCHLAVTGKPQFRLVLAGLLWGDLPEAAACANLRKTLSNLRDLVGAHLIITPQTVAFDRRGAYWLDVEAFLAQAEHHTPPAQLRAAADLYQGDFLDGFYVRRAQAFDEWVVAQREQLRRVAQQVFQALSAYHAQQGEHATAIACTGQWLALDPWQEKAHRQMMTLLVRHGERNAALAQYETCRRVLARDLGIQPMAETTALYQRIRASSRPKPHNLPIPTTSFVGREAELAQVAHLLAEENCRLLTILGPGGVGKTRLALQAAHNAQASRCESFTDGVYWASLYKVHAARALPQALAGSLGLASAPDADHLVETLRYLRNKDLLLVLDGFERLINAGETLTTILQHAPRVKLLVTSRQRLNLAGEWRLDLGGLPYAPLGTRDVETYSATQLFLQRARQARPTLTLTPMDYQAVTYICELVEGLPLAIELAAAGAKTLSCLDIARALESGLDVLTVFTRDQPGRHQSIRAAFEYSWVLLAPAEQRTLCRLAIFHDGCDKEAAAQVVHADLAVLAALMDKSLLRCSPSGRYELHELLRQFAEEKLAASPAEHDETAARHARYYLDEFMAQREQELRAGKHEEALNRIREETGNLQTAWQWASTHDMNESLARSHETLSFLSGCSQAQARF